MDFTNYNLLFTRHASNLMAADISQPSAASVTLPLRGEGRLRLEKPNKNFVFCLVFHSSCTTFVA